MKLLYIVLNTLVLIVHINIYYILHNICTGYAFIYVFKISIFIHTELSNNQELDFLNNKSEKII